MSKSQTVSLSAGYERGGSMVPMLLWLLLFVFVGWNGYKVFHAYYLNWQVEDVFQVLSETMEERSEADVRDKMEKLFALKYIEDSDLPAEFFDQLSIRVVDTHLEVSSVYSCSVWPLGEVEAVDENGEYEVDKLGLMDSLRNRARIVLDFEPYAYGGDVEGGQ